MNLVISQLRRVKGRTAGSNFGMIDTLALQLMVWLQEQLRLEKTASATFLWHFALSTICAQVIQRLRTLNGLLSQHYLLRLFPSKTTSTSDIHTLLEEIASQGASLDEPDHEYARRELLAAARSLCYKLETPIESLLRICWAEISSRTLPTKTETRHR